MVKKFKRSVVVWDKSAYTFLQAAYDYIKEDSPANAEKVREEIVKIPEVYRIIQKNIPLTSSRMTTVETTVRLKNTLTVLLIKSLKRKSLSCASNT